MAGKSIVESRDTTSTAACAIARPRSRRLTLLRALAAPVVVACTLASALPASASRPAATSATARITADWKAFFAGSTPAARKIALLQDGPRFAAIIRGQAKSPLARSVSARVIKVTVTSSSAAKVRYTLLVAGKPALANQTGAAVLQKGTWKVGVGSFCALLALEQVKSAACPRS
ncbi:MAG: hypothetical protein M0Z33_00015 [Actinomycetota bacterium]|nr:hypothetical protein [Actinomycetota bacterium]